MNKGTKLRTILRVFASLQNTASGSIYTTASTYDIALPSFVDTVGFITAELSGGGWADVTSFEKPPQLRLYAPTSYGSASRTLRYYFKGTYME